MKKEDVEKNKKSFNFSLKLLAYLTFFYFGVKLAFTLFLSLNSEFREVYGMINLIFSPILFWLSIIKKEKICFDLAYCFGVLSVSNPHH